MYQNRQFDPRRDLFYPIQSFGVQGSLFAFYIKGEDSQEAKEILVKYRHGMSEHVKEKSSRWRPIGMESPDYEATAYINVILKRIVTPAMLSYIYHDLLGSDPFEFMYWLSNAGKEEFDGAEFQYILQKNS